MKKIKSVWLALPYPYFSKYFGGGGITKYQDVGTELEIIENPNLNIYNLKFDNGTNIKFTEDVIKNSPMFYIQYK